MIRSRASKILAAKRDGLRCSRLFLGLVLLFLGGIFTPAEAQYANGYSYRVEVDFVDANVSGGPHTNFPVLISSTLPDLRTVGNGGKVENANGYDIIFTSDEDGTTQLAHEIESYVSSTGEIIFWVRAESFVATTKIYMFYGNSSIGTFQGDVTSNGATGVWDNGYKAVWHLNELQAEGTHVDSVGANDATRVGNTSGTGQIGGGQLFDGNDDYIDAGSVGDDIDITKGTVSSWAELDTISTGVVFSARVNSSNNIEIIWAFNQLLLKYKANGVVTQVVIPQGPTTIEAGDGEQHFMALTWDTVADEVRAYLDGVQIGDPVTGLGSWVGSISAVAIGDSAAGLAEWDGMIDEVRVSNVALGAQWIETEYNNQDSPAAFYALGPETEPPAPVSLVKRAFLADGTPLSDGDTVRKGAVVKYLIYFNNPGGVLADVSVQDVLDPAFAYQASTLKVNNSTSACALEDCTAGEEGTIFSDVDALAAKTDAVDGDVVSITGSTIDAGDQNVANGMASAAASKVWALLFEVKMQ